ncbi:hypothetical protein [Komagataeibacter medellinensis]|uniref:Transmembrane protein n=2 Tax=Komagataeibacter medellinensis TaxID=1177712 RepID=G2I497_KOMMN|nr:hypothetical protein [Komagataeibacter medellinensis]BAK82944.1 hypothetical protein GLX_05320 [Komagataeibacter medellinensis NBRC 3288]
MALNYIKFGTFFISQPHPHLTPRLRQAGCNTYHTGMDMLPAPSTASDNSAEHMRRRRLERLLRRLPARGEQAMRWLLQPGRAGLRLVLGCLLMIGGVLSFLPILGLWMLPLGIILLAEDVPLLRRLSERMLEWIERRHPNWLAPETGHTP